MADADKLQAALDALTSGLKELKTSVSSVVDKTEKNAQAIQRLEARPSNPWEPSGSRTSGSGGQFNNRPPKLGKLDFPKYSGKDDPFHS
jgi:hypothetical protein